MSTRIYKISLSGSTKENIGFPKISDIALGGINEKNFKRLKLINPTGFAGISYFEKKKGP